MQSEQTKRLADVVASALECAVAERAQFLSDVCGDNVALRDEAESLLRFEENAKDFIEIPAYKSLTSDFPNGVSEPLPAQEPVFESEAEPLSAQEPVLETGSAMESMTVQEPLFENETLEFLSEPVFEGEPTEPPTAHMSPAESESTELEQIDESGATESMAAYERNIESEAAEIISEQELSREDEAAEFTPAPTPILESESGMESVTPQEPLFENETLESPPEPIFESEPTEPLTAQVPPAESESTELVSEQEQIADDEATESMAAHEANIASYPIEMVSEEEPSREDETTELTPAPTPIFENKASESPTAQKPGRRSEAVIESGPERRRSEIEYSDQEKTVAAATFEEPTPKPKPIAPPAKKAGDSFEIPAYPPKELPPSRSAVWKRRAAVTAAIFLPVAMAVALIFALLDASDARHERDVAESARSRSERIDNYLQRILSLTNQDFTSVWPIPQNRNVTITEMLDRIAPSMQKELADQPEARGEFLRIIGKTYASQGQHDAAEKNLRAALKTQNAFYGEQNAEITETMVDLGILLYRREKFAEAEELLEKGITFLRKQNQTLGGRLNAVKLAHALDRLGAVKFYRGNVKAGRAILEEALGVATQAQPDARDRPVLTHIQTDLGGLLVLVGELTNGERLLQEALAESRSATNAPQWETGMTMQMLGELALAKNRPPEAEEHFLAAEEIYRKTLGEKNLYFARNLERRATVSLLENDVATAEQLAQRSLALTKECSPDNKLPWTDPMMTLSIIMLKENRPAEGEDYLRKTIHICEEQSTRNYAAIALAKIRLSQLLLSQRRFTEAENIAFEAHNQAQQHLEPPDPMRKATTNNLIEIYEAQDKHKAAQAVK